MGGAGEPEKAPQEPKPSIPGENIVGDPQRARTSGVPVTVYSSVRHIHGMEPPHDRGGRADQSPTSGGSGEGPPVTTITANRPPGQPQSVVVIMRSDRPTHFVSPTEKAFKPV